MNTPTQNIDTLRHSTAHLLAAAVTSLFPDVKVAIGPSIAEGFYYDFDRPTPFTPEDLVRIEKKMKELAEAGAPFVRTERSKAEAIAYFTQRQEKFKVELLQDIPAEMVTFYQSGDFTDLCRGPHLENIKEIRYFKLLSVAGAYWRGDESREQLQRIYGTAFFSKAELKAHLDRLEEAKKRDHRRLGKDLELFSINEQIGPGLVLWHPQGGRIRLQIENFWREQHVRNGYELVYTPHIGKSNLWETSGHLNFYRENMYAAMQVDGQDFYAKPMNCPFHILMYNTSLYSYKDLPVRWAELGTVYRYEKSGVLHGLMRVRGFTQDDAHIVCRPDQLGDEVRRVLRFSIGMLHAFGFTDFSLYVATKPKEKAVGDEAQWHEATRALEHAIHAEGLTATLDEGGGAFYGPKIDIKIKDALSREWQCSTIQFDFNEPERFDMTYVDASGKKARPYMIHRALMGSLERFFGILIEHYAGAFPVWMAPEQAVIATITDSQKEYAESAAAAFRARGIRVTLDDRNEKIGLKIREASMRKIPYILIVGDKEKESGCLAVRARGNQDLGVLPLNDMIQRLVHESAYPELPER